MNRLYALVMVCAFVGCTAGDDSSDGGHGGATNEGGGGAGCGPTVETRLNGPQGPESVVTLCDACSDNCPASGDPCDRYGDACGDGGTCISCCGGSGGHLVCSRPNGSGGGGPWACDDVSDCILDVDPTDCEFSQCVDGGCVYGMYLHGGTCGTPENPGTCKSGACVPIDGP